VEQIIRRPDWDRGRREEVCAYLRIGEKAFDELLKEGVFPTGDKINRENHTWTWQEVVAFDWLMKHMLGVRDRLKNIRPNSPPGPEE
jgi:predicted DNA-binding transcriptional regulator AlpA